MNTIHHQNQDPLAKRVLGRITDDHVTPRPRWEFLLKNYVFWGLGALAVVCGALAFSATLFEIQNVDWQWYMVTHTDFLSFFLSAAPFLWVSALTLSILVGYWYIRRTAHGYRYPLMMISCGAIILSLSFGGGLHVLGFGEEIEEMLGDHPPFYRPILVEQRSWWVEPEKGLLGGDIENVASGTASLVLRDFSGQSREIDTEDLRDQDLTALTRGETVRIVGAPTTATSSTFHACFVLPWKKENQKNKPSPSDRAATSEQRVGERSEICKNIRSYEKLHASEDGEDE
jgi:hypothetical protein